MRFRHHLPEPRLRDLVQGYWELEDLHLAWPEHDYNLPERTLRLMFSAEALLMGSSPDTLRPLGPVTLTPFSIRPQYKVGQGRLRALVAELYPWGARQLLGWRADLAPEALDATLSATAWAREVLELLRAGEWDAARAALEAHLWRLAQAQGEPGAGVLAARQIYKSSGMVRVAELAEALNLSPRTLERQFAQQIGISAKTLARVVRFDEASLRIRADPAVSMAELTFDLGFFDQAHLIREFKALSSLTPGAFAALSARRTLGADLDLLRLEDDQNFDLKAQPDPDAGRG